MQKFSMTLCHTLHALKDIYGQMVSKLRLWVVKRVQTDGSKVRSKIAKISAKCPKSFKKKFARDPIEENFEHAFEILKNSFASLSQISLFLIPLANPTSSKQV
jgi:uncharacterized membrane-anchored protein YjiN (DUF445 family)